MRERDRVCVCACEGDKCMLACMLANATVAST